MKYTIILDAEIPEGVAFYADDVRRYILDALEDYTQDTGININPSIRSVLDEIECKALSEDSAGE